MWNLPAARVCDYTLRCKGCGENIAAPVETMPDTWIVADCPLCGERRRYLPPDIFRGRLSYRLRKKPVLSQREAPPRAR
jgi:rRNA maturation protein Nop10